MHLQNRLLWAALPIAALAACGGAPTNREPTTTSYTNSPTTPEEQTAPGAEASCPLDLAGAMIRAETIDDGIALAIWTEDGNPRELQARIHGMLDAPGVHHPELTGNIPATLTVTDTADGARVELRPAPGTDLAALRRETRAQVVAMENGSCPKQVGMR